MIQVSYSLDCTDICSLTMALKHWEELLTFNTWKKRLKKKVWHSQKSVTISRDLSGFVDSWCECVNTPLFPRPLISSVLACWNQTKSNMFFNQPSSDTVTRTQKSRGSRDLECPPTITWSSFVQTVLMLLPSRRVTFPEISAKPKL